MFQPACSSLHVLALRHTRPNAFLVRIPLPPQTSQPIGADDLLPLFCYVAACAQVPKMYSQVQFMELFTGEEENCGEAGYYIALAHSTVSYILTMKQ